MPLASPSVCDQACEGEVFMIVQQANLVSCEEYAATPVFVHDSTAHQKTMAAGAFRKNYWLHHGP